MFTNTLLGLVLMAFTGAPTLNPDQLVGSQFGMCPDGTVMEIQIYDTNKDDPEAALYVFKRGDHAVGAFDVKEKKIYLYSKKEWKPITEVQEKYPSPCDLPDGTGL